MRPRLLLTGCFVAAAMGIAPASASAATATVSGGQLVVTDSAGDANILTVSLSGSSVKVSESSPTVNTLSAGPGCTQAGAKDVTCAAASVIVNGGDGNDRLSDATTKPMTLNGGVGDDWLDGGPGADAMNGGSGNDSVSYWFRTSPVTADLAGDAGDGELLENDTIASDVEILYGGAANDRLTGNAVDNGLDGGPGDDTLSGAGGNDYALYWFRTAPVSVTLDGLANDGESGEKDVLLSDMESIWGGGGADTLVGDGGANTLVGGAGNDAITGGRGQDVLNGGAGVDALSSRDNELDELVCGSEIDATVEADLLDNVNNDCETVNRAAAPPDPAPAPDPSPVPAPAPEPAPTPSISAPADTPVADLSAALAAEKKSLRLSRAPVTLKANGRAPFRIGCPAGRRSACKGTIVITMLPETTGARASRSARPVVVGKTRFTVASGKSKVVEVRMSRGGRRRVLKRRKAKSSVSVSLPGPNGKPLVTRRNTLIKAPGPRP